MGLTVEEKVEKYLAEVEWLWEPSARLLTLRVPSSSRPDHVYTVKLTWDGSDWVVIKGCGCPAERGGKRCWHLEASRRLAYGTNIRDLDKPAYGKGYQILARGGEAYARFGGGEAIPEPPGADLSDLGPALKRLKRLAELCEALDDSWQVAGEGRPSPRAEPFLRVLNALKKFFKGLDEELEAFVAAQAAGLPTVLIGPHGSGKTTLVKAFYSALRMDGRPLRVFAMLIKERHTPNDVFYSYHLPSLMKGEEKIVPKAIAAEAVFIDEVFANPLILSALKDFLEERRYDRYPAKWLFFAAATNPPNKFYGNLLPFENMADLDRFDVAIPVETRLGFDFADIVDSMASSSARRDGPEVPTVEIGDLEAIRREIFSVPVRPEAVAWLWAFGLMYSSCVYEDRDGNRRPLDKFSAVGEVPCATCSFRKAPCARFALQPYRFVRSALALAKALAWLKGKRFVDVDIALAALGFVAVYKQFDLQTDVPPHRRHPVHALIHRPKRRDDYRPHTIYRRERDADAEVGPRELHVHDLREGGGIV